MAKPRKMLGRAQDPAIQALMRQMDTQSAHTLAAWAIACARARYLPPSAAHSRKSGASIACARARYLPLFEAACPGDARPRAALDAAQAAQSGARTLREAKAAAREANACAKAPLPPAGEAAARACAVAASALWNPASALGMVFYGAAASVYAAHGADLPAQDCDREAQREFAWLLDSLRAASVPDEPNPAKIRWTC